MAAIKVIVRRIGRRALYLSRSGEWNTSLAQAARFNDAVEALAFCLRKNVRDICLVSNFDQPGSERLVYPFGGDPAVKRELKKVRKAVRQNRDLKRQRHLIQARIDMLMAEGKETRKQIPFKRPPFGNPPAVS